MNQIKSQLAPPETVRKHKEFLFPAVATYYQEPIAIVRGEGMHVWDDAGNRYLDCFGGVLTVSLGHVNPKVNAVIIEQIKQLQH
ncbi:MAG: aminotransferase class III-fold pyridoxal phosphate-dependent enzyme, partial [Pyrinomonadaceae bacterium]